MDRHRHEANSRTQVVVKSMQTGNVNSGKPTRREEGKLEAWRTDKTRAYQSGAVPSETAALAAKPPGN